MKAHCQHWLTSYLLLTTQSLIASMNVAHWALKDEQQVEQESLNQPDVQVLIKHLAGAFLKKNEMLQPTQTSWEAKWKLEEYL